MFELLRLLLLKSSCGGA